MFYAGEIFFQAFELVKLPEEGWKIETQFGFAHIQMPP